LVVENCQNVPKDAKDRVANLPFLLAESCQKKVLDCKNAFLWKRASKWSLDG
jgi:hypothetical protein